ncbi:hypothetical protein CDO52_02035 [Nocardiopsis gilva YIM 90087]|uniref:Zinc-finger domain-containing protein n=1 Tax=Nocardiopsis gilva YIM 90087 TaxID=1235441 RepID=A0A223S0S6_9ACTN|nr:hypothetical protein CDO52_02035 [Nocardiopsis gilva YIM 90087]
MDAETLALSAEGLLDDDEERAVRDHVAACPRCAEQLSALADVPQILAEVPAPPLPEETAARLDAALRAEVEERRENGAETPCPEPRPAAANVVPLRRRSGPARWLPYLAGAAAAVFVIGGGAAVVRGMMTPDQANHAFEGAPEAQSDGKSDESRPEAALPYRYQLVESGTEYTASDLATQAEHVLTAQHGAESLSDAPESAPPPLESTDASTCLQKLSRGQEGLAMVDVATFRPDGGDGSPVDVWVMYFDAHPDGSDTDTYDVVVVPSDCATSSASGDSLAETSVTER